MDMIHAEKETVEDIIHINYEEEKWSNILSEVEAMWYKSEKNTFTAGRVDGPGSSTIINDFLGVGKKKRSFNPSPEGMKQKEQEQLRTMKYSHWIDEVYRMMRDAPTIPGDNCVFEQLTEQPFPDGHKIAHLSENGLDGSWMSYCQPMQQCMYLR